MSCTMDDIAIRPAKQEDCQEISRLIKELSVFEKIEDQVKIGPQELETDGFGENPFFKCVVAEYTGKDGKFLVGFLAFYYTYSTFQGRSAYIEDLYVNPEFRQRGIGKCLWKTAVKIVLDAGCSRLDFIVLKWNTNAMKFYSKMGACNLTDKEEWTLWRLEKADLNKIANS